MHALTTNGLMILNHSKDMRDKLSVDRFYEAQMCPKVIYELTSDTTRTLIGPKGEKPMFYCAGKLPLPDKAALRSTRKDE